MLSKLFFIDRELGEYRGRCTGRSTGMALGFISEAMSNPGKEIPVNDHWDTIHMKETMIRMCRDICFKLSLDHFIFDAVRCSITYDIYHKCPTCGGNI